MIDPVHLGRIRENALLAVADQRIFFDAVLSSRIAFAEAKNGPKLALTVGRPGPDLVSIHTELRRPGVTLEHLHLEYLAGHPDGYRYSAFCGHYRRWVAQRSAV